MLAFDHGKQTSFAYFSAHIFVRRLRSRRGQELFHLGAPRRAARLSRRSARPERRFARARCAGPATGRLPRRSAEDIAKTLEIVVSLLGSRKNGLRAEQIREELSMQAKELPRILKEGLSRKKLRTVGQKRATTYFVR